MATLPQPPLELEVVIPNASAPSFLEKLDALIAAVASRLQELPEPQSHLYRMPPDGFPFNEVNYVAIPAVGVTAAIITFKVPGGMNGVIRRMGNNFIGAGFQDGSGNLVWQILADGQPIRNHQNILGSLGNPANPAETDPIRVYEGQTISLVVTNVAVAPVAGQLSGGRLSGYYYPIEYDGTEAWGG
jgi:hypothetical protein